MAAFQVTCHAPDDMDAERRIRGLGGQGWWFPTEAIIQMIENRQHEFWASIDRKRHEITVGRHGTGRKYLTTAAAGFPPKGLLSLPACPLAEREAAAASDRSRWTTVS